MQLFLAKAAGYDVPTGYTFVRQHERGAEARRTLYRSRSALRLVFAADEGGVAEQDQGPAGWFEFEIAVKRWLESENFSVEHVAAARSGDGGVDLYATKGKGLSRINWVVQAKYSASGRKVAPAAVRELVGALVGFPSGTRGLLVTNSAFTSGAETQAAKSGVTLGSLSFSTSAERDGRTR